MFLAKKLLYMCYICQVSQNFRFSVPRTKLKQDGLYRLYKDFSITHMHSRLATIMQYPLKNCMFSALHITILLSRVFVMTLKLYSNNADIHNCVTVFLHTLSHEHKYNS